jgi:hypothetical protein
VLSASESPGLRGRGRELGELEALVTRARSASSGALVLSGEAGVGKTALLDCLADRSAQRIRVERMVASEAEVELPYAGLQLLCAPMMTAAGRLAAPAFELPPEVERAADLWRRLAETEAAWIRETLTRRRSA